MAALTPTLAAPASGPLCVINCTRQTFLAREARRAEGFFGRLCGLLATPAREFDVGRGLWIHPSKGVHMLFMRYAIDAVYLDREQRVVFMQSNLRPWRLGAIRREAAGVLELPAGSIERTQTQIGDEIVFCQP